jgi:hypothetical protein
MEPNKMVFNYYGLAFTFSPVVQLNAILNLSTGAKIFLKENKHKNQITQI